MGNYYQKDIDFIRRTLALVNQYQGVKNQFGFEEQFNHTLLINCLLGLIVLPKEKILSHIPKEKLPVLKHDGKSGIKTTTFHDSIKDTKDLIKELRDSVAHFNINFKSETKDFLIDRIEFINDEKNICIADFSSEELFAFVNWYALILISNFERHG